MNQQQKPIPKQQVIPRNPYPGLEPYKEADHDKFFGRDADRDVLIDKILTHRLTLLFAASGVGKSSLLQAAVIPQLSSLEGENLDVAYYADWVSNPLETLPHLIIETLKSKQRLAKDFSLKELDTISTLEDLLTFCEVFVHQPFVLVLDQFEEFFRYQRKDKLQFQGFIDQLTQVITKTELPVSIVISMREDFALEMNAFKPRLPTVLFENFYRLEKLDRAGAASAIRIPVEQVGYSYEEKLLSTLLDDLQSQELKRQTDQLVFDNAITSIEPPYLQIVCKQLWELNASDKNKTLRLKSYQQAGEAEGLLRSFLEHSLQNFSKKDKNLASKAFDHLVAQRGVKMAYPVDVLAKILKVKEQPLANVMEKLEADNVRILRRQQRGDSKWYELYHDMFSPSIESWNKAWKYQQQKKQRWVMGSTIVVLLVSLGFLVESFLWVLNNNFPANYLFKQQEFRLMNWGLRPEPLPEMTDEIKVDDSEFTMGELSETFKEVLERQPEHKERFGVPNISVSLNQSYFPGKYEITYEQYDYYVWLQHKKGNDKVLYPTSSVRDTQRGDKAVTYVSWNEAVSYTEWLSEKTGDNYRLPTEVEWEYAARAETTSTYWWGETANIDNGKARANCKNCGSEWDGKLVSPVGQFPANPYGLHDTAGNVWEWTCSEWRKKFDGSEKICATEDSSVRRVIRGGSWSNVTDFLRSSARNWYSPVHQNDDVGFRVFRFSPQDK